MISGIDIYDGEYGIDLSKTGASFVIVKASQGTTAQGHYRALANAALKNSQLLGLYHFVDVRKGAEAEAAFFAKCVSPYLGHAALFLDWENNDVTGQKNITAGPKYAKAFLDKLYELTGVRAGIYMNKSCATEYDWTAVAKAGYPLWGAQYLNKYYNNQVYGFVKDPTLTTGWGAWGKPTIYQYTSRGRLSGYAGELDLDVYYGSMSDWAAMGTVRKATAKQATAKAAEPATGTVEKLMKLAYADLGYYAPSDPEPGSKAGRYCAKLMGESWLAGPSTEIWWCCMWVSMMLDKAGVKCPGFPTYNTDLAWNGGAKSRAIDKAAIRRGDILIFDWNFNTTATDHIGFATGSPRNGYVNTIEGNVGNAVKEKVRPLSSIRYALRPKYSDAAAQSVTASTTIKNPTQNGKKLDVDGVGGYNTVYEAQAQLGTVRDGEISGQVKGNYGHFEGMVAVSFGGGGSQLVGAIQKVVGAAVDNIWGPETSTKLQKWLIDHGYSCGKCGADSYFGHDSVCALQRSLNDGKWREWTA